MEGRVDGPPPVEGGTTMTAQMGADSNGYASVEVDLRGSVVREDRLYDEVGR